MVAVAFGSSDGLVGTVRPARPARAGRGIAGAARAGRRGRLRSGHLGVPRRPGESPGRRRRGRGAGARRRRHRAGPASAGPRPGARGAAVAAASTLLSAASPPATARARPSRRPDSLRDPNHRLGLLRLEQQLRDLVAILALSSSGVLGCSSGFGGCQTNWIRKSVRVSVTIFFLASSLRPPGPPMLIIMWAMASRMLMPPGPPMPPGPSSCPSGIPAHHRRHPALASRGDRGRGPRSGAGRWCWPGLVGLTPLLGRSTRGRRSSRPGRHG